MQQCIQKWIKKKTEAKQRLKPTKKAKQNGGAAFPKSAISPQTSEQQQGSKLGSAPGRPYFEASIMLAFLIPLIYSLQYPGGYECGHCYRHHLSCTTTTGTIATWQQPWWSGMHCSPSWLQGCGRHCVSHNAPVEYKRPCSCYFHQSGACWGWPTAI